MVQKSPATPVDKEFSMSHETLLCILTLNSYEGKGFQPLLKSFSLSHCETQKSFLHHQGLLVTVLQSVKNVRTRNSNNLLTSTILFESRQNKLQSFLDLKRFSIEGIWRPILQSLLAQLFDLGKVVHIAID